MSDFVRDYATEPVLPTSYKSGWSIAMLWIAGTICVPMIMMGITIAQSMPLVDGIKAVLVGQLFLSVVAGFGAYVGVKKRLSTAMIMRQTFGEYGGDIIAIGLGVALLGWFGVQTEMFGKSLQEMLFNVTGYSLSVKLMTVVGGLLMCSTAVIGMRALNFLSWLSAPLLFVLLSVPLVLLWPDDLAVLFYFTKDQTMTFGQTVSFVIGGWAVGVSVVPDLTRFAKTVKAGVVGTVVSFIGALSILYILSALLALISGESDFIKIMSAAGWVVPAMFIIMLATWTTNDTNVYLSSLSFAGVFQKFRKWQVALVCGLIGTGMATLGITTHFISFLIILGVLFPPAAAVYIVDFFLVKEQKSARIKVRPMVSWLIGAGVGYATSSVAGGGIGIFHLSGAPAFDSVVVSLVVAVLLLKLDK